MQQKSTYELKMKTMRNVRDEDIIKLDGIFKEIFMEIL